MAKAIASSNPPPEAVWPGSQEEVDKRDRETSDTIKRSVRSDNDWVWMQENGWDNSSELTDPPSDGRDTLEWLRTPPPTTAPPPALMVEDMED